MYTGYEVGIYNKLTLLVNLLFALHSIPFLTSRFLMIKKYAKKSEYILFIFAYSIFIYIQIITLLNLSLILSLFTSISNFIFLYTVVIYKRYSGNLRGMGAPGHFLLLLNFSNLIYIICSFSSKETVRFASNLFTIEVGLIFLVSGTYKIFSGYSGRRGIEIGLVNPMWSSHHRIWMKITKYKKIIWVLNQLSIWGEIIGGILLITLKYSLLGSIILGIMFLGVMSTVRLGLLVPIIEIMLFTKLLGPSYNANLQSEFNGPTFLNTFKVIGLLLIIFNTLSYLVLQYNFYFRKKIPFKLQNIINIWIKFLGINLWRVFTADITAIKVNISTKSNVISKWGKSRFSRWSSVLESISLVSVITSLKYYENQDIFYSRLLKYVRTLSVYGGEFEIVIFYLIPSDPLRYELACKININGDKIKIQEMIAINFLKKPDSESRIFKGKQVGLYG